MRLEGELDHLLQTAARGGFISRMPGQKTSTPATVEEVI